MFAAKQLPAVPCIRREIWFLAAVLIQLVVIFFFFCTHWYTLSHGKSIQLGGYMFNPHELLRGDYVAMRFWGQHVKVSEATFAKNESVFVIFRKSEPAWTAENVVHEHPKLDSDHVAIKGRVNTCSENQVYVDFGLEEFFVPPDTAPVLYKENAALIELTVDEFGAAAIRRITIRGREVDLRS